MPTITPSKLKRKYEKRIIGLLNIVAKDLEKDFDVGEPFDLFAGEEFHWALNIYRKGSPEDADPLADVSVRILEAKYCDDPDDKFGVNFSVDVVEYGGAVIGGCTPYNYSNDVWVDRRNSDAVEERFSFLDENMMHDVSKSLREHDFQE